MRPRRLGGRSYGRGCSGVEPALGRDRRSAAAARRPAVRRDDAELHEGHESRAADQHRTDLAAELSTYPTYIRKRKRSSQLVRAVTS